MLSHGFENYWHGYKNNLSRSLASNWRLLLDKNQTLCYVVHKNKGRKTLVELKPISAGRSHLIFSRKEELIMPII